MIRPAIRTQTLYKVTFLSVVLLQLLLLNPIQGLQLLMRGVSTVVSVCLGWRLPDRMPSRRNQPIQTNQVKIGLNFLLFLLKPLRGGAGFYICWFTCPGSPEHEKLMTKCWKDRMVTSCGVGERKLVLMLMDFAMLVKLCESHALVRMWECGELKLSTGRWYLVPACSEYLHSLPWWMYSFLPFDLCGVDTKPQSHGSFYKGNPVWVSVSGWFPDNDVFQWTAVINSKRGGKKKDWLSWAYWSPYLQQF